MTSNTATAPALVATGVQALLQFAEENSFTDTVVTIERDERPFGFGTWSAKLRCIDGSIGVRHYCLVLDPKTERATGFHSLDSFTWNGWDAGETAFDALM